MSESGNEGAFGFSGTASGRNWAGGYNGTLVDWYVSDDPLRIEGKRERGKRRESGNEGRKRIRVRRC